MLYSSRFAKLQEIIFTIYHDPPRCPLAGGEISSMKTLRLTEKELAALHKKMNVSTIELEKRPSGGWPTRRDIQTALVAAERATASPGKPKHDKKALLRELTKPFDRWPAELAFQCRAVGILPPVVNYPFLKEVGRRFKLDCAWPDRKIVFEIDGGVHRIADKFARDIEKHRLLREHGWDLHRVTPKEVNSGEALALVERALTTAPVSPA